MIISGEAFCLFFCKNKLFCSYSTCLNGRSANNLGSWRRVKRSITPSVAALFVIQVTDFCQERWQRKQKKASRTQYRGKSAKFSFQPLTVSTEQSCHHSRSALWMVLCDCQWFGHLHWGKQEAWTQLLCARTLEAGGWSVSHQDPWGPSGAEAATFRSMGCSSCHLTLRMATACEERQLKQRKKLKGSAEWDLWPLLCFSLSLKYNSFIVSFYQLLLCREPGRALWPSPPKTGVALMGSNTEFVIIREGAFFKPW